MQPFDAQWSGYGGAGAAENLYPVTPLFILLEWAQVVHSCAVVFGSSVMAPFALRFPLRLFVVPCLNETHGRLQGSG